MKIKGYGIAKALGLEIIIKESTGFQKPTADICTLLDQLLEPSPDHLKAVWNLDSFVAPLFKLLTPEICRQLISANHEAIFGDTDSETAYKIYYLPNILCSITKNTCGNQPRLRATIYGLDGFFADDQREPDSVYALEELGNKLLTELEKIGIHVNRLTSPVGGFLSSHKLPNISTINDIPPQYAGAVLYAERCDAREWREACQVGNWGEGECFSYDLSAAYGSAAARLPDLRFAQYLYSKKMIEEAFWGFLYGTITIFENVKISPIMVRLKDGRMLNPVGTWNDFITLDEVRFIERNQIGCFRLKDGWFVKFQHWETPLQELMEMLYRQRTQSDPILNTCLKRIPNGIVGKLHEHHNDFDLGNFFNPLYHSMVTTTIRLRVAELIYQNQAQDNIIRINTDGLISDRPLDIPKGTGMGKWRLVSSQASLVLSPELAFSGEKHPKSINYVQLRTLIAKNPRSSIYKIDTIKKRITLREALRDGDLSTLGELTTRSSSVDLLLLGQNQIRSFDKFPRTGESLIDCKYGSEPIRFVGKLR